MNTEIETSELFLRHIFQLNSMFILSWLNVKKRPPTEMDIIWKKKNNKQQTWPGMSKKQMREERFVYKSWQTVLARECLNLHTTGLGLGFWQHFSRAAYFCMMHEVWKHLIPWKIHHSWVNFSLTSTLLRSQSISLPAHARAQHV